MIRIGFLLLLLCAPALACGSGPTHVEWAHWRVLSSERLWLGAKYRGFPLCHLVDGDPRSTWVFRGLKTRKENPKHSAWGGERAVIFAPREPFWVDEVRILSGYERRKELFERNNRVKTLQILRDGDEGAPWGRTAKPLKTVRLSDRMGWHSITLSPQKVRTLGLNFVEDYKGRDDDLCVSEVEFRYKGKKVEWRLPRLLVLSNGSQDDGSRAVEGAATPPDGVYSRTTGRVVAPVLFEREPQWDATGRWLAVPAASEQGRMSVHLYDAWQGSKRDTYMLAPEHRFLMMNWKGGRLFVAYQHKAGRWDLEKAPRHVITPPA